MNTNVLSPSVYILLVANTPSTSEGRPVKPNFLLRPTKQSKFSHEGIKLILREI